MHLFTNNSTMNISQKIAQKRRYSWASNNLPQRFFKSCNNIMNISRQEELAKAFPNGIRCQKCLVYGHWSYECTGKRTYAHRTSRTKQLKENVEEIQRKKNVKANETPLKKTKRRKERSSSSSDSSTSSDSSSSSSNEGSSSSSSDSSSSDSEK